MKAREEKEKGCRKDGGERKGKVEASFEKLTTVPDAFYFESSIAHANNSI